MSLDHSGSRTSTGILAALTFFVMFGAWWGVALLLADSGLKSRSTPSVLSALVTFVLFLGLLWMMLIPRSMKEPRRAPIAAAETQIATFRTALDSFRADNGCYPTGSNALQGLLVRPAGAPNWRGPYVASDSISKDPPAQSRSWPWPSSVCRRSIRVWHHLETPHLAPQPLPSKRASSVFPSRRFCLHREWFRRRRDTSFPWHVRSTNGRMFVVHWCWRLAWRPVKYESMSKEDGGRKQLRAGDPGLRLSVFAESGGRDA